MNLLEVYRAKDFHELVIEVVEIKIDFVLRVLDCIKVFENGRLLVAFLDGTEIDCK